MHDRVVWCRSKEGAEDIRSFELSGKEIFLNFDGTKSKEEKNKKNRSQKKAHRGQSVRQVMVEAKQHQNGNERGSRQVRLTGIEPGILDGHRDRQIRRLRLPRHSHSG